MKQSTKEKFDSRQALLKAAESLFTARGYAAVSTRELAEKAEVNLGAITYHFGSKSGLFVETLEQIMEAGASHRQAYLEAAPPESKQQAALALCQFLRGHFEYLLRPKGPRACQLIFREILSEQPEDPQLFKQLIDLVARKFGQPLENTVVKIIKPLRPLDSHAELLLNARSILGQCSLYVTHRPFLENLIKGDLAKSPLFERTIEHIMTFSLRALGLKDREIQAAIAAKKPKLHQSAAKTTPELKLLSRASSRKN